MKKVFIIIFALLCTLQLSAGDGYRRFDNKIKKFLMGGMDTTYVGLPATSWEVPASTIYKAYFTTMVPGLEKLDLRPWTVDVGVTVGYHGLDLMYTFALDRKSDNFYFDWYDNYWGVSINIGNYALNVKDTRNCDLKSHSKMITAYYAVFGNRYSHPATTYGNYIQKRSAGSPIINIWYDYHSFRRGDVDLPGFDFDESGHLVKIHQGALTAGYGYNLALADGRVVFNATAGVGVAFPWALAANGSVSAIFWCSEHFRMNFVLTDYYQKSWSPKLNKFESKTIYGVFSLTYCFGK